MIEKYRDRTGLPFEEYNLWLPPSIRDWPTPPRTKDDTAGEQRNFHIDFKYSPCWWCGCDPPRHTWAGGEAGHHQLHHLAGGMKGRSHDRYLFCWLCRICHEEHDGPEDLGHMLYLKWKYDGQNADWVRTAIRHGRFLPDLSVVPRD